MTNTIAYKDMNEAQVAAELAALQARYEAFKARGLNLNMARGKPAPEQLDLSLGLLDILPANARPLAQDGEDVRNYGNLTGLLEARTLMGKIMGVPADEVLIGNNSSLNMMYDTVARSMLFGVSNSPAWSTLDEVKFLCPAPGYDRHFGVTQSLGITNVVVEMRADGPDMDAVEHMVSTDSSVKGIWCVPKYANPTGITYSDAVVRRFAALKPAAQDFRIFWDNAYAVHDLYATQEPFGNDTSQRADGPNTDDNGRSAAADTLLDLRQACIEAGNPDLYYMFASTSKITFAGGGIAAMSTSPANLTEVIKAMSFQTIGADKINQLRHVAFLRDLDGVKAHMQKHAATLAPKFAKVAEVLSRELTGLDIARWTDPRGGYFISFDGPEGTAKRTVQLAKEAGVVLTNAGATYPHGQDPHDQNIRIAPSYPSVEELAQATELFCTCARISALEKRRRCSH